MKVVHTISVAFAGAALAIMAQALMTMGTASAEPAPPAVVPANIGIIDSAQFGDQKTGIVRVVTAVRQIETKFEPLRAEIRGMRDRLNTLRSNIQSKRAVQDAATTARQEEEADQLDVQIKRKAEDSQKSYQKETSAMLDPLQNDIHTALIAYAKAKGLTLVFDMNRVPVLYAAPPLDITRDFINEYNRTHPAGTAPAPRPSVRP
jgi:Skp family chaperone for outer membrane proteins